jgi:hypothetical protein
MNLGITVAFISPDVKHSTYKNFKKFGSNIGKISYWDDAKDNKSRNEKSKIGYYFAFYFQKKYVYIHKIVDILPPCERPKEMLWISDRNVLCLSERLQEFTWEEWKNNFGFGAPYTPDYHSCQTGSWSINELKTRFSKFNFNNLHVLLTTRSENLNIHEINIQNIKVIDDELEKVSVEESVEESDKELDEEIQNTIQKLEELNRMKAKKEARKNIVFLRQQHIKFLDAEYDETQKKIEELNTKASKNRMERQMSEKGQNDEYILEFMLEIDTICKN